MINPGISEDRRAETHLSNGTRLVVASDKLDSVGVPEFQAGEEGYRLDAEQTAIDVIACDANHFQIDDRGRRFHSSHLKTDNLYWDRSLLSERSLSGRKTVYHSG